MKNDGRSTTTVLYHYLIGVWVLVKGILKIGEFNQHAFAVLFLLFAGILMIIGTALKDRLERRIRDFPALFYMMEGMSLWVLSYLVRMEGSRRAWAVILILGAVHFIKGVTLWHVNEKARERVDAMLINASGIVLLVMAIVLITLGWHARPPWMAVTGFVSLLSGIVMLVMGRITGRRARSLTSQKRASSAAEDGNGTRHAPSRAEGRPDHVTAPDDTVKSSHPPHESAGAPLD